MPFNHHLVRVFVASLALGLWSCGDNETPLPKRAPYQPQTIEPLSCVPNLDGKLDADELQTSLDTPVSYLVNPAGQTRPIDLAGQINAQSQRRWDISAVDSTDQVARISAQALQGRWYANSFPTGEFVVPFDLSARLEGIYRRDAQGFYLLGIASTEADPTEGRTLMVYDQPIALFRYPLEVGKNWVTVGRIQDGRVRGLTYAGKDTYSVKVEAAGQLNLPDLSFEQAFLVRTKVTLEPAVGQSITRQQISFMVECFGEVARVTSQDGEEEDFFSTAVELRRLGIEP